MSRKLYRSFSRIVGKSFLFALGISLGYSTLAQTPEPGAIASALDTHNQAMAEISRQLNDATVSDTYLDSSLQTLNGFLDDATKHTARLQDALATPTSRLEKLGPPPVEGEPPESIDVVSMRQDLTDQVSRLDGLSKRVVLAESTVNNLIGKARSLQRQRFISRIQARGASPFSGQLWVAAAVEIVPATERFFGHFEAYWRAQQVAGTLTANIVLLLVVLSMSIGVIILPYLPRSRKFAPKVLSMPSPSALDKKRSTAFRVLGYGLLTTLAGAILFGFGVEAGLLTGEYGKLTWRVLLASISWMVAWTYFSNSLSPSNNQWRRLPIDSRRAARLRILLLAIFALFVYDRIVFTIIEATNAGVELASAQSILASSLFSVLLWCACSAHLWRRVAGSPSDEKAFPSGSTEQASAIPEEVGAGSNKLALDASSLAPWQDAVLIACRGIAILILLFIGLGYISLAYFMFHRITLFVLLVILAGAIRTAMHWGAKSWIGKHQTAISTKAQEEANGEPGFWLGLTLDMTWFALCIPAALLLVGFDWLDISRWFDLLGTDMKIGDFSLSFTGIFTALLVLLLVNGITRRITGLLNSRLLEKAHMGQGERTSITTLVNYTGMVVAILLALGIVGFGWTQLAIIAGALSVGIGFGLQGIVNNFVSGLILLFERPVKVGDWVIVSSGEGYVRNIGATSTEIETFDHSSIIVPNSQMITESLENWFHKSHRGRVRIQLGVSYSADADQVRTILLDCAAKQSDVVKYPYGPRVRLLEFGDSSLDFELVAFIMDMDRAATTRSDLHFAIFKALNDAGIEIPFPQRDLHIKSGDLPIKPGDLPAKN